MGSIPANILQAAFWMALWLSGTLALTVAGRELAGELPVFVIMMFRSAFASLALGVIILVVNPALFQTRRLPAHAGRNVIHYGAQYAWFTALGLIPISQVIAIEFTMPIWIAILAALFLGEHLTRIKIIAIALGFAGILLITRPGTSVIDAGHFVALAAALGFSASMTLTKFLTRTDHTLTIIFYMFAIQLVLGAIPAWYVWTWPEGTGWFWIGVVAVAGTFSHFCLTRAMSLTEATIVGPLDFLRVPLSALLGYFLYREGVDWPMAAGAALILAANVLNLAKARA